MPLSVQRHAGLRLSPRPGGGAMRYALLGLSELPLAVADFPVCLAKDGQTGRFDLIALLSLTEPRNLFRIEGHWQSTYLPEGARLAPFRLSAHSDLGLAVDEAGDGWATDGEPLFAEGRPSPALAAVRPALEALVADVDAARAMIARFAALDLIRAMTVVLGRGDGEEALEGLYTLDPEGLATLADADVLDLYRCGFLSAASLMSASLAQVERLRQLHNATSSVPFDRAEVDLP
ncbi:SapC family protein [Sphingomonas sp. KR1UV-12]|uniref:SapC family protein n=1 Tax=Sphingomonas aurea TaxID=3063994 RepID=A0ABT9EJL8_9SPHN|nr:SapC family protein [Sphingomonas sp. KR1UV-12]MDP1026986.1 SapC family protein [Sphingomonas sp. KR1UV-12]